MKYRNDECLVRCLSRHLAFVRFLKFAPFPYIQQKKTGGGVRETRLEKRTPVAYM